MEREEIKTILPHREPMLLLDTVEVTDGQAQGTYHVTGDEFFVQGHFPGDPIVPGVILCEMLAQNCCVLLGEDADAAAGMTPMYTSLDNVRFKHPVHPGDTVDLCRRITRAHRPFYFAEGTASVGGTLCVSASFSFALIPKVSSGSAVPDQSNDAAKERDV